MPLSFKWSLHQDFRACSGGTWGNKLFTPEQTQIYSSKTGLSTCSGLEQTKIISIKSNGGCFILVTFPKWNVSRIPTGTEWNWLLCTCHHVIVVQSIKCDVVCSSREVQEYFTFIFKNIVVNFSNTKPRMHTRWLPWKHTFPHPRNIFAWCVSRVMTRPINTSA